MPGPAVAEVTGRSRVIDASDLPVYRALAGQWASELLCDDSVLLLDTETTTLYGQVIEVGVIDTRGRVLFEELIRPSEPIAEEATRVHGLRAGDLLRAPALQDVADELAQLLRGRRLVAYKSSYDRTVLTREERRIGRPVQTAARWDCAMDLYSAWCGQLNADATCFRRQRPPRADQRASHRAVDDCRRMLEMLTTICSSTTGGLI